MTKTIVPPAEDYGKKKLSAFGRDFEFCDYVAEVKFVSFLSRINFDGPNGCWEWMGSYSGAVEYGVFSMLNRTVPAHRFAWYAFKGPIPDGYQIHHICNNPPCVNPEHLMAVTPADHLLKHTLTNPVAIQASQTHCKNGHPLSGDNVYTYPNNLNKRRCRICLREWMNAKNRRLRSKEPKVQPTHCRNGHEYTSENSYWYMGIRYCRACHAELTLRQYHEKHPEARTASQHYHATRTECKRGHPWVEENILHYKSGDFCKTCHIENQQRAYARRKAKYQTTV